MYTIKYGFIDNNIDVTQIAYSQLITNNIICIPSNDLTRTIYFSDPMQNVLKSIFISSNIDNMLREYDHTLNIFIDLNNNTIDTSTNPNYKYSKVYPDIYNKLSNIQKDLKLEYGNFNDEYPEQIMATKYLTGNEKVLEIGGNIGRNSMIIGKILNQNSNNNFVSLESDSDSAQKLLYNKLLNNLDFFVENSALSKRNLIQSGWTSLESDQVLPGYTKIPTITLENLKSKYNIVFDTLIIDCEGAFYLILVDTPEILDNIKTIIMENDYVDVNHKNYIDNILKQNNFHIDYSDNGGDGYFYRNFYEVWTR